MNQTVQADLNREILVEAYRQRRQSLRERLQMAALDAILISNPSHVRYLTGFSGEDSWLYLDRQREFLLSDSRFTLQASADCPEVTFHQRNLGEWLTELFGRLVKDLPIKQIAVEAAALTLQDWQRLHELNPPFTWVPTTDWVELLRQRKDASELANIERAVQVAESAFRELQTQIRPDHTEKQVADHLEFLLRQFGATQSAFPIIVASGPQAALPHANPGARRIGDHPFLLVDWGATVAGYHSDLTRMLVRGPISERFRQIHQIVREARQRAIAAIRPGVAAQEIDLAARQHIEQAGFGDAFSHSLGHGLGLDVHELPGLRRTSETLLEPGMVVTVEPGIYLEGWGGIRLEDDVLVTETGARVLSSLTHDLDQLQIP